MSNRNLSAKDKAFEKERCKFRKEIHERDILIQNLRSELQTKSSQIQELESKIMEQKEWIERLLEYMDIPDDQRKLVLQQKELETDISQTLNRIFRFASTFAGGFPTNENMQDKTVK